MKNLFKKFIETFVLKFLSTETCENIIFMLLKDLAEKTGTKLDDKLIAILEGNIKNISTIETSKNFSVKLEEK